MAIINQFKTITLLLVLSALLIFVGSLFGGMQGMTIMLIFAIVMNLASYFYGDKLVLKMHKAKQLTNKKDKLYKLISDVAKKAKIPTPKVYIIPDHNANAFACGRNPKNSSVAVTVGILNLLNEKELKGVIAHELAHIKNRDILIATIAATIATVISYVAMMARFAAIFGGMRGGDRDGGNLIELLVLAILTPIIATMIQLAISRSREYLADETGATTIHDPTSLANALEKLSNHNKHIPMRVGSRTTASLFISNPFEGMSLIGLFSTHPPMKLRIQKLKELNV